MANVLDHLSSLLAGRARVPDAVKQAGVAMVAVDGLARPTWRPRTYASYARDGMMRNAVAYRCVRMIAEAASSVKLVASADQQPVAAHALLDLLRRPAPGMTSADMFER